MSLKGISILPAIEQPDFTVSPALACVFTQTGADRYRIEGFNLYSGERFYPDLGEPEEMGRVEALRTWQKLCGFPASQMETGHD